MADTRISDLTADASPGLDSLTVTVDDPAGTPATKKSTLQSILDLFQANLAFLRTANTDTGTSGTSVLNEYTATVTPTGASTRQTFGQDFNLVYNANQNITTGGYISALRAVVSPTSTANVDKIVVNEARYVPAHTGNVTAAICYEAVVPSVSVDADTSVFAGFYIANVAGISNIGNISQFYSLRSEYQNAVLLHAGQMYGQYGYDDSLASGEIAPAASPGIAANRYYSGIGVVGTGAVTLWDPNVLHATPLHVPERTTFTRIGINVTTGAAGGVRLGIYRCAGGIPTDLILDAGTISVSTTGEKEITISQTLPAGMYMLAVVSDVKPTVTWHTDYTGSTAIGGNSAAGFETMQLASHTYGALPGTYPAITYVGTSGQYPRVWLRKV